MYLQYQGQFFQHVSIIAEPQFAIEFKTRYDDCDQNPKERIQLSVVQKIDEIIEHGLTINQIRVGGDQGLLKHEWINKICGKKPAVIVCILEMNHGQMQQLFARYHEMKRILSSKGPNNQQKMMTKIIVILFSKAGVGPEVDAATTTIKQNLEIDSKNIFNLPQTQDAIYLNIRKIKKLIVEYSNNYYDEKYKKYKKNVSKHTDVLANEKNLTLHFKMAVIDEISLKYFEIHKILRKRNNFQFIVKHLIRIENILNKNTDFNSRPDKAKKHYESAYSECENLMNFHRMHANKTIIPNNFESIDQNYDIILKVEELRFIADAIKIRILILLIQEKKHQESIQQFITHYKKFKESVEYFDSAFQFENTNYQIYQEYKWRTELFKVFITEMQKETINKNNFIDQNLFNLIINVNTQIQIQGCVVYGQERFLLFQGFKNMEKHQANDFTILKKPPLFFGRQNYIIQGQNRISANDQKLLITRMVKNERLFQENKEIEQNMLSENLAFLNMCEELFPSITDRQKLIITYRRLFNCSLSRDFEQFSHIAEETLQKLQYYKMNDIKTYILENYETFLKENPNLNKLLNVQLELILLKEESIKDKDDRNQQILKCIEKLDKKSDEQMINTEKENYAFKIEIEYNQNRIKAFEKSTAKFKFVNLAPSLQLYKKVVINLNDSSQVIEFDMNLTANSSVFEKQIELTANNIKLKNIQIDSIVISKEIVSQSGNKFTLNFFVPSNAIKYKHYAQLMVEKPHEPVIDVTFKRKENIYLNELFQVQVSAALQEGASEDLEIKNPQLYFSECIQVKEKSGVQTITVDDSDNPVFQQNGQQKTPIKNTQNIPLNFEFGHQIITKLLLRINKFQEEIKFQALIKYQIFNKKTNTIENRSVSKILDLKIQQPFQITLKWSVSNNQQSNQESKRKNSSVTTHSVLPVEQMCNLQIKVTSQMDNICIHKINVNMNEKDKYIQLIRDIQFQKKKISKNESVSINQYVKTLKPSPSFKYGTVDIQFNSLDDYSEIQEQNTYNADLLNILIEPKQFKVEVDQPEVSKIGEFFEIDIKITNKQNKPLDLKITLNERESKKFMVSGKVIAREIAEPQKELKISYKLLPVDIGRFRLPGFQVEQKFEETYSTIYDSQCLKHIVILPPV